MPTTSTLPASFLTTPSTEGASALHVLHQGAQNQNATGLPVNVLPSSAPPASNGAANCRTSAAAIVVPGLPVVAPAPVAVVPAARAVVAVDAALDFVPAAPVVPAALVAAAPPAPLEPHAARPRPNVAASAATIGRALRGCPTNEQRTQRRAHPRGRGGDTLGDP